jgi:hypothetical protein
MATLELMSLTLGAPLLLFALVCGEHQHQRDRDRPRVRAGAVSSHRRQTDAERCASPSLPLRWHHTAS